MKISNKGELQQIASNHSSDIDFKDFIHLYTICTAKPYSFLVNNTILSSDNFLNFICNLIQQLKRKNNVT